MPSIEPYPLKTKRETGQKIASSVFLSFCTATDYRAANYSLTNTNPYIIIYKIEQFRTFCPFFQTIETAAGWRIPVTLNIPRPIARPGLYVKSIFIRKLRGAFRLFQVLSRSFCRTPVPGEILRSACDFRLDAQKGEPFPANTSVQLHCLSVPI